MTAPKQNVAVVDTTGSFRPVGRAARTGRVLVVALLASGLVAETVQAQPQPASRGEQKSVGTTVAPRPVTPAAQRPAQVQPLLIAMMPFDGKDTPTPPRRPLQPVTTAVAVAETLAARPQSRYYKVLGADLWSGMARLKHHGRATDIRPIARLVKANIIIGGWLEATPSKDAPKPYRLTVTLYDDQGQLLGQLGYDVDKSTLNPQKLGGQATALFQMIDLALKIPGATPGVQAAASQWTPYTPSATYSPAQQGGVVQSSANQQGANQQNSWQPVSQQPEMHAPEGPVVQLEDKEAAPLGPVGPFIPNTKEAHERFDRRPPWLPAFDLRVGYLYNTRTFTNQGSELHLPRTGANGAVIHAEIYPFSFAKSIGAPLAGLGVRVTALLPVWRDVGQTTQDDKPATGFYGATEQRVEAALRWQYNYWGEILRPIIELEGLFGDHSFNLTPKQNIDFGHLPSSEYRYLGALIGGRLFFSHKASARIGFTFAKLLSLGAMSTAAFDGVNVPLLQSNGYRSYGPGDGALWRVELGTSYDVWRGITIGAGFYYEQNKLNFAGQGNILQTDQKTPVTDAQDEYMGIMFTVGYAYRPFIR